MGCAAWVGAAPPALGGVNGPAPTLSALTIVTCGVAADVSDSHVAAATVVEKQASRTAPMSADIFKFII
jgi:hypothetical protein